MSSLKNQVIRLAYNKPEYRDLLLPVLAKYAKKDKDKKDKSKGKKDKSKKNKGGQPDDEFLDKEVKNPNEDSRDDHPMVKLRSLQNKPKGSPGRNLYEQKLQEYNKRNEERKKTKKDDDKAKKKDKS